MQRDQVHGERFASVGNSYKEGIENDSKMVKGSVGADTVQEASDRERETILRMY